MSTATDGKGWIKQVQDAPNEKKNKDDGRYDSFYWNVHKFTGKGRHDTYNDLWVSKYYQHQVIVYGLLAFTFILTPILTAIAIYLL